MLSDGRAAEQGTHAELLARGGQYARLWRIFEGDRHRQGRAAGGA